MSADPCPVEGCPRLRNGEMCRAHWRRVSADTRAAVWATWKAWRADFGNVEKMRAYRTASGDALTEARAADLLAEATQ